MIPTIESIVEGLVDGTYTKSLAVSWLHQHAEGALNDLRDAFAMSALAAFEMRYPLNYTQQEIEMDHRRKDAIAYALQAYLVADEMLRAREVV